MQVIYAHNRFICLCTFQNKDVPKSAGFRWEPKEKYWYTERVDIAAKLEKFCDPETKQIISGWKEQADKNIEASKAKDADVNLPCPEGLEYLNFQKAGILYCLTQFKHKENVPCHGVLIADDMGL